MPPDPLTDDQLDRLAERLICKVHEKQHSFWIDPEQHYQDHIAMREVVLSWKGAQSIFWKAFIGLVAIGAVVIAGFAALKGVGK